MARISVDSIQLINRVVEYYRHSLTADSKGLLYLRDQLGIHHNLVIEDFRIGYSDGSLVNTLPEDPAVIGRLTVAGHSGQKRPRCVSGLPCRSTDGYCRRDH